VSIVDNSGTVWVFNRGANGNLYERHLANSVWSSWTSLGSGLSGTPSAVVDQAGILRVYVRTTSGIVCEDYKRPGQAWSGVNNLNNLNWSLASNPTAISDPKGIVRVLGVDNAGGLDEVDLPPGGIWSNPIAVLATTIHFIPSAPTAIIDTKNTVRLYVRSTDDTVNEVFLTDSSIGQWTANPFGATSAANPMATVDHDGIVRVYIVGSDGRLQERFLPSGGNWSTWADLATTTITRPIGTVVDGHNVIDVLVRLPNNTLGIDEMVPGFTWTGIAAQPGVTLA
jgi:hypothetical protein